MKKNERENGCLNGDVATELSQEEDEGDEDGSG